MGTDTPLMKIPLQSIRNFLSYHVNKLTNTDKNMTWRRTVSLLFCCFQEVLTLRNLWASGRSVIVSYEHNIASCHGDLWPHIPYWWANKCKAEALIEAFEHRKKYGRPGILLTSIIKQPVDKMLNNWA